MRPTMDAKVGTVDGLLDYLFAGQDSASRAELRAELDGWLRLSRRFRVFVAAHGSKIRAKLRGARGAARLGDVRAELQTACLLLNEERFTLAYETYVAAGGRGPDFTVTFKTHTPFNVEVRRLRATELAQGDGNGGDAGSHTDHTDRTDRTGKLLRVLGDKVGQMPPSTINLLWLAVEGPLDTENIAHAATALRERAESKDEEFFTRQGYRNAAHFLKQYSQLSAVVLAGGDGQTVWQNPSARHKPLPEIVAAIERLRDGQDVRGREKD